MNISITGKLTKIIILSRCCRDHDYCADNLGFGECKYGICNFRKGCILCTPSAKLRWVFLLIKIVLIDGYRRLLRCYEKRKGNPDPDPFGRSRTNGCESRFEPVLSYLLYVKAIFLKFHKNEFVCLQIFVKLNNCCVSF